MLIPQSVPASYKPSPLSFGSPTRSTPFRRAESPVSPSPLRYTTPNGSPTKNTNAAGASRFGQPTTPTSHGDRWSPRRSSQAEEMVSSSPRATQQPRASVSMALGHGNALSQLQPSQARILRDGFQILDRDCDGVVNREDVADMLGQLGEPP